jgi:hypothetical protein
MKRALIASGIALVGVLALVEAAHEPGESPSGWGALAQQGDAMQRRACLSGACRDARLAGSPHARSGAPLHQPA